MKGIVVVLLLLLLLLVVTTTTTRTSSAFLIPFQAQRQQQQQQRQQRQQQEEEGGQRGCLFLNTRLWESKKNNEESEAERLLRKARELKAAAAQAEATLHASLLDKKAQMDAQTDKIIEELFAGTTSLLTDGQTEAEAGTDRQTETRDGLLSLVKERVEAKRYSTDVWIRMIERLHERELTSKGYKHVEPSIHHDHTEFKVVPTSDAIVNPQDYQYVYGKIDVLIDVAKQLDQQWLHNKHQQEQQQQQINKDSSGTVYRSHFDAEHWTMGDLGHILQDKANDLRREHDEQFQRRIKDYYDKALINNKKNIDNQMVQK